MTKVAFWYDRPQEYTGGLNYMRNLLFALSTLDDKKIQPYIFFGRRVDADVVLPFEALATVVRTSVLDRKTLAWYLHKILFRCFGSLAMVHRVIHRHGISIVSHTDLLYGKRRPFRIVSWIPDFQYLHLPEFFTRDPATETVRMRTIAAQTDALILSSYSALEDYRRIAGPAQAGSVSVLQFVSQPSGALQISADPPTRARIEAKYGFHGRYFFLPNQFWKHKNHRVAFAAVKALKAQGMDVLLLCTGNPQDYRVRHTAYIDGLRQFIDDNDLARNILILGLIDYADVLFLMRHSVATLNPSRFEGWSSTVEEARSMGKRLILSDIPVHREQDPPEALFFDPDDEEALAQAMMTHWASASDAVTAQDELLAAADLRRRTVTYAEGYSRLVLTLGRDMPGTTDSDTAATTRTRHRQSR